jgi:hypothetical protein
MSQRRYRIYLDFYEDNLYHVLTRHTNDGYDYLPEPVIWYMVKVLSSACIVLQHGTSLEAWKPITHLDMQLPNVFLGLKRKRGESEGENTKNKRVKTGPRKDWSEADWQVRNGYYHDTTHALTNRIGFTNDTSARRFRFSIIQFG